MKSILTIALVTLTFFGASAGGPDSNMVQLSTTTEIQIPEPEEWVSPMPVSLQEERTQDIFKRRLSEIWQKHTKQLIMEKEESIIL